MHGLKFDAQGLITAIAQDRATGEVRMVAWMNAEALEKTLETGLATFYSRSRNKLWVKGETSNHRLRVESVIADCDGDTLLLLVVPEGPSCHTGRRNCFFTPLTKAALSTVGGAGAPPTNETAAPPTNETAAPPTNETAVPPTNKTAGRVALPYLFELEEVIRERQASSADKSYTRSLLDGGAHKVGEKITEEARELVHAVASETNARVASEAADLLYHLLVSLRLRDVSLRDVVEELASRSSRSGLAEKASRKPPVV